MRARFPLSVFALLAALPGCATITRGTTDQVQFRSSPEGARAIISLGQSCITPCALTVDRKDEFTVHFEKPGFHSRDVDVKTQIAGTGAASFAGNAVVGGLIGMGTDAVTGAALDHAPNPVTVVLTPDGSPRFPGLNRMKLAPGS